ncbi:MAG: lipid A export permease/ATP-binding protein MsbA [Gammaproteobacteria bacterium]|nr:MAG: lipid A export permease/ATP-binding protein MsbA [Gammaproteobacteria bacterium]
MSASQKKLTISSARIYLRLLVYVKPYIGVFLLSILGYALSAYYSSQFIHLLETLIKNVTPNDSDARIVIPLQVIGFTIMRSLGAFIGTYCLAKVSLGVIHQLRKDVFGHITSLPQHVFDSRNSGQLISIITYNVNGVAGALTDAFRVLLQQGTMVIFFAYTLITLNWKLTMAFMVITPFIGILVTVVGKRMRRLTHKVQDSVGDITHVTSEMINGVRVMRTFGGETYEKNRFDAVSQKNYLHNMKIILTSAASTPMIQIMVALAMAGLIYAALTYVDLKNPATFVAYLTAVGAILNPIRKLGDVSPLILKGVAAADSVFELIDQPSEDDKGAVNIARVKGAVSFNKVCFSYPNQESEGLALKSIDLTVAPGEIVALVGQSGSGKSSLVNLLPRFYNLESGNIAIDDVPITDYKLASLRDQIAFVSQQVTLFEGSIADNIAYGRADKSTFDEIKRAADLAYASEFIEKLPQGFDTQIGEGGARLSGGQRQRLVIARAILKNSPILVLDEATSALDNESERYIQAAMEQFMKGRTTFVIAHRLSTIEHADRIVVMENGKIVEQGKHKDLLERNGAYAKLYAAQFHDEMDSSE